VTEMAVGTAPGKVILFGEHAVVYGHPAIAVPVWGVTAEARVEPAVPGSGLTVRALDLNRLVRVDRAPEDEPLAMIARLVLQRAMIASLDAVVSVRSTIPMASGMGSGAAVSTAIARGLCAFCGIDLSADIINELVFEVEKLHHGTPSGIDNTVIVRGRPVFFVKGRKTQVFSVASPLSLIVGDTGIESPTKIAVRDVRAAHEQDPDRLEGLFAQMGELVLEARMLIEDGGHIARLGKAMDRNQMLLKEIGVSCEALDRLVRAAKSAGALGAKLSGAGRGGSMIALSAAGAERQITTALRRAGAANVIETVVGMSSQKSVR
jgi:mevalonate kinase